MDYHHLEFDRLWQYVIDGDEAALVELLGRFEPMIASVSRVNGILDEDIAQDIRETLIRAIQRARNKRQSDSNP